MQVNLVYTSVDKMDCWFILFKPQTHEIHTHIFTYKHVVLYYTIYNTWYKFGCSMNVLYQHVYMGPDVVCANSRENARVL